MTRTPAHARQWRWRWRCNTAEPSRELSKGDVVAAGEITLAVAGAGWTPVRGGLTEVRTSQHGTHPLPSMQPPPGHRTQVAGLHGQEPVAGHGNGAS
jgi:hypothetical protein